MQRHNFDLSLGYRNDSAVERKEIFQLEEVFPMKTLQPGTINQLKN